MSLKIIGIVGVPRARGRERRLAVEAQHAPRESAPLDRDERVVEARGRHAGGIVEGEWRVQAGLYATRHARLREHDDRGRRHTSASTHDMSRTAVSVPRTVPVTFERPTRGR